MKACNVFYGRFPMQPRKHRRIFLALCFYGGLLLGAVLATQAEESFISWMRTVQVQRVSIVSLLGAAFLPFLISAYAVLISQVWLLFPVCFLKAFSFGFCVAGVSYVFGSAGWLVCGLLLFTDLCTMPMLLFFWLRHIDGAHRPQLAESALTASLLFLAGSLDHCLITPFLAEIINF